MTTLQTKNDELKGTIFTILGSIAPEADFETLDPTVNLQEALDIDSFDFLNFLIALNDELGVEIPEADYGQLVSLNDIVNYLSVRV
ncbi:MAG: acyl carrier protein [Anaerolineaceae bacterium]|nr:acyl carrier protein [Anaerolineaceae bacterium]